MYYLKNKLVRQKKKIYLFSVALICCLSLALIIASISSTGDYTGKQIVKKQVIKDESPAVQAVQLGKPISHPLQGWQGGDSLHEESHAEIHNRANESVARLQSQQILPPLFTAPPVQLSIPIKSINNTSVFGFYTVANYFDHDPITNQLQEYRCGTRTYDASDGYNHTGTDFMPFPFPWQKMDRDEVHIIAAAAGVIIDKQDGYFDRECVAQSAQSNRVILQHPDGTQTWYLHMKNGSVLTKSIGDSVAVGEYLGVVGSSGRSNGPHLHFEVHDANGNLVDPFFNTATASCNPTATESWWINQPLYNDSGVNDIIFSADPPQFLPCQEMNLTEQTQFAPGDLVIINVFYRNDLSSNQTQFNLLKPDGSSAFTWTHTPPVPHTSAAVWSFPITMPVTSPLGQWELEVSHNNVTYAETFSMTSSVANTPTPTATFTRVPTAAPATATSIPATNTSTPIPATSTPTSIPATSTPTPVSATSTPTSIPATSTSTSIPATATSTTAVSPTPVPPTPQMHTGTSNSRVYLPAVQR